MPNPTETIDLVDSSKVAFFQLLNQKQNTAFKLEDFYLFDPVLDQADTATRNTKIKLIPLVHTGYYGVKTLEYNRINLADYGPLTVSVQTATTTSDVLEDIFRTYEVLISVFDIIDELLVPFQGSNVIFYAKLKVSEKSLLYFGEVDLFVDFSSGEPPVLCTPLTMSSIPGHAQAGCSIPSQTL
jgi:hypothetical protein